MIAAGAVAIPTTFASAAIDPGPLVVEPVPTEVLASAEDLTDAGLGTAVDAHLAGDNVFVEVSTTSGRRVYWRPLGGDNTSWSNTWGGRTLTGDLLAAEHDTVLLDVGSTRVLAWSRDGGDSRTVPDDTVLGQGAQLVALTGEGLYGGPGPVTQPVTGGDEIPIRPANPTDGRLPEIETGFALTDALLYAVDQFEWPSVFSWHAATGKPAQFGGDPCDSPGGANDLHVEDAHGRFALATCPDGVVGLTGDSAEVYADIMLAVPMERDVTPPRLGDGFALGVSTASGDLLAAPYLGGKPGTLGTATAFDLDDAGTAVVLVNSSGDVRIARDLEPWSSTPATEIVDHAPPSRVLVSVLPVEPVTPGTGRFEVSVSARDVATPPYQASGVAGTELRARIRLAGETEFGDPMPVVENEAVEYPVGATVCWEGLATDNAGNDTSWQGEECSVVPDVTNQLVATPLPPVTDTAGGILVGLFYSGVDDRYFDESDIRYRTYPRNEEPPDWTVLEGNGGGWDGGTFVEVPDGNTICFQARGYDLSGTVGDWTPQECTVSDALDPRITSATYPRWIKPSQTRVVDGVRTADPRLTWTARDAGGIEGYSVQRNLSRSEVGAEKPTWVLGTSYTRPLTEAGQHCLRVKAKDLAGHLSPWSGWRCSTMPVSSAKLDGESFGPYHHRVWPGSGDLVTTRGYSGVAVYAKVTTGPRFGSMKVYMGSRFLGTVNAHASETGSKFVWLSPGGTLDGKVRFVANAGDFVDLREFYVSR